MLTLDELAAELPPVTELGITRPARWDDIANFDQTLTGADGTTTEITEADAEAIRAAWTR